jgi:hypothetical protein
MSDEQARERPHTRVTEASPRWQQVLAQSSAWKHFTVDLHPDEANRPQVRFYDNRVVVENCDPKVARALYSIMIAALPPHGFVVRQQNVASVRRNLTVHVEGA